MQTNNENALIENLRRLMADRGISAQKLSYEARIPASRISQLLRGSTRNQTLDTMLGLVRALDVTIDALVTKHGSDVSELTRN